MANSLISMIKGNSTLINNTEVLNGQVLFDTDKKAILLDDNNTRSEYCGADKSNKNLAPIENGNTATRGYSAGSYVVWKEQLYKVLTQINSGTAFVVGTNIALDTVGAELTQISADTSWYGTSSTAAGTTAKIATTTDSKFTLVTGAKVRIKFTYANTASAPTLNVDSKGAKSIKAYDTTAPTMWWKAGDVVDFTYDGTNWIMGATQGQISELNNDLVTKQNKTWNVISINASITNSYTYELPQSILSATDIYLFTGIPSYNDSKVLVRFFPHKDVAESYYYRQTDSYVIKFAFRYNDNTNALYISDYYVAGWGDGVTSLEKIFYR